MSTFSSSNSYGLCGLGSKRLARKSLSSNKFRKKSNFRQDPIVVLSYFVVFGVLISGFASFGL